MNVKRFTAENMQQALRLVSQELGPDAAIISSRKLEHGIEVVAALDNTAAENTETGSGFSSGYDKVEIDRQLRLQRELEIARTATRVSAQQEQEKANRYAERSQQNSQPQHRKHQDRQQQNNQQSRNHQQPDRQQSDHQQSDKSDQFAANLQDQSRIQEMQSELRELKNWLVSHQGSAWDTRRPLTWQQSQLWQRCQDMGLEPEWADRITSLVDDSKDLEEAWQLSLKRIAKDVPIAPEGLLEQGGRYAVVGPTGAGKTTTVGKIAARFSMRHGPESVAFVSLDNYRVAGHDQLRAFSRILGIDLRIVGQDGDLNTIMAELSSRKLILVDCAGLGSQDPHFSAQLSMLKKAGRELKKLLVLPLTSQGRCLQENYEHFKEANLSGCVFTKLDECFSLGAGMSIAAMTKMPLALVTDGPHIPDDLHYPDANRLVKLAEQMARMARTRWQAADAMNDSNQQHNIHYGV